MSKGVKTGKVRILGAVVDGYGFFFGNFGRILHIAWIPGLLMVLAGVFVVEFAPVGNVNTMGETEARSFVLETVLVMLAGSLFELLMTLIAVVGLYRLALFDYQPKGIGYLKVGFDDFRLAGAWLLVLSILYITFMTLIYFAILFVAGFIGLGNIVSAAPAEGTAGLAQMVFGFLDAQRFRFFGAFGIIGFLIYMWVYGRLYLAMPAVIDRKTTSIRKFWNLTKNNKYRMMFYLLFLFISQIVFFLSLAIILWLAIIVANVIIVIVMNGEAIDALKIVTQDINTLINDLSTMSKVVILLFMRLLIFLLSMLGWSIIVGSATGAYRDATKH